MTDGEGLRLPGPRKAPADRPARRPARGPSTLCALGVLGLLLALALASSTSQTAQAAGRYTDLPEGTITDVQIQGNATISTEKIRGKLLCRAGQAIDPARVDADLRSLDGTKWFSDVQVLTQADPSGKGYILVYRVAEAPVLTLVEFRGANKVSKKDLEENTQLKVGSRANYMRALTAVNQIKTLYGEKGYELAEVELLEGGKPGDTRVVFNIFEGPKSRVVAFDFEGNTFATDAILRTKLASRRAFLGLIGGRFHRDNLDEDVRKLKEYYQGQGFFEVEVTPVTRPGESLGDLHITYDIWEGTQYKVRKLIFEGNKKIPTETLKAGLLLHSGQPYSDTLRDVDRKALEQKYFSVGCIDTRILPEPRHTDQKGVIDLVYKIEEGEPYILGELIVRGNTRTRDKVVRREADMAGLLPGERLDPNRIELYKKRLMNLRIFQGPQATPDMGKPLEIKVVNRRPHDKPYGDISAPVPDLSGISLARLQNPANEPAPGSNAPAIPPDLPPLEPLAPGAGPAGVMPFGDGGTVAPGPAPGGGVPVIPVPLPPGEQPLVRPGPTAEGLPTPPIGAGEPPGEFPSLPGSNMTDPGPDRQDPFPNRSYADIVTQVDEAPTGNFMFSIGASSYAGLQGTLSVQERNFDIFNPPRSWSELTSGQAFRGGGQYFQILASPGTQINRIMATFGNPYVFDLPIGFNTSAYAFQRLYPDFTDARVGGRFSLGRQFGTQTYADIAFRVEDVSFFGFRSPAPAAFLAASGHTTLASLRPSLRFDNRNDPFAPNKGQYLELAFEQGWGSFTWPKFTVEGRQYFTLGHRPDGTGKRLLKFRGYFGVAGQNTPVYERFFAGDFQSMRGFAYRGVGPHILGVNVGGVLSALGSVEYQVPLVANDQFHAVVFSDFGTVEPNYQFSQFRVTIGTGIRINIPQLGPYPLAFDIGFPVAKEPGDRTRVFAFFMSQF